ncbi:hypothetical protein [Acidianus sp.]|uniref:hypothetical protein n=1 Tax=Acidianus sp. TaxID=1872104 RepID=UPI00397AA914
MVVDSSNKEYSYFFDTNILIIWLYEKNSDSAKRLNEILDNSTRINRNVLTYNLEELYEIIGDSYIIFYYILISKILPRWSINSVYERNRILSEIDNNFDKIYEEVVNKYNINPSDIRKFISRLFFNLNKQRIVLMNQSELKDRFTNNFASDLIDYISGITRLLTNTFNVVSFPKVLMTEDLNMEFQLIEEGISSYIKVAGKEPSRYDQLIYKTLYLLLKLNEYDQIVFIANDTDFDRMHRRVIAHLQRISNSNSKARDHALRVLNIFNRLKISNLFYLTRNI